MKDMNLRDGLLRDEVLYVHLCENYLNDINRSCAVWFCGRYP